MAFPSTPISAPSSIGLQNVFQASTRARNGEFVGLPKLSNGDLAQIADYYRSRGVAGWDRLARIALGFFEDGDKFAAGSKFDAAHVREQVPASALSSVWSRTLSMSTLIDAKGGGAQTFTPRPADSALFDSLAGDAFKILERERGKGKPFPAARFPRLPVPKEITDRAEKKKGDFGIAVIVVLVLVALSYRKGK